MKQLLVLIVFIGLNLNSRSQIYIAGSMLSSYTDINPDTVMHYVYYPYTTQIYHLKVFGNVTVEFMAKGSSSSGGSIALINARPLDPHLFLSFGRLDSVYDSTSTGWLVTKVAKPLLQGNPINDPGAVWDNDLQYITDHSASFGWTKDVNDWIGNDRYLGLKYQNGNTSGYGWIRLQCPDGDSCYVKDVSYSFLTTGLQELDKDKLSVFPNPTHTKFTVSIDPFLNVEEISVFDATGKCVWRKEGNYRGMKIDLSHQPDGIYFLHLQSLNGTLTKKIVKE